MASHYDDISINTLIGAGSFIKGDVHIDGFIRFDGDIDGNWVMGRLNSDSTPTKAMTSETTMESTGRRIKILNILFCV